MTTKETQIEQSLIDKLVDLKYTYRLDIRDREALEQNFRQKAALMAIIADYNSQFGTNHNINDIDLYYQDVQQRFKDHKYSNQDYPRQNKIDIVIVVDMLLTGFDSKYLNILYVDKNLKFHGLIQAFSRTNRVLNDSKPWGNILDFRYQEDAVDEAIKLFSGKDQNRAKEIWLVDPGPVVVDKLTNVVVKLTTFMQSQGLDCTPEQVAKSTQGPSKQKMTRQELIDLISSNVNLMEERDEIIAYINSLKVGVAFCCAATKTTKCSNTPCRVIYHQP